MRVGIDISQIVHEGTGVAIYTRELVRALFELTGTEEYVLFGVSLRKFGILKEFVGALQNRRRVRVCFYPIPPTVAEPMFNRFPRLPIEWFAGGLDVYHSSDWLEPRASCPKVAVVHDLAMFKFPEVAHPKILATHRRKLELVKQESEVVIAVSKATKKDLVEMLGFDERKIVVVYEAASRKFRVGLKGLPETKRVLKKYGIEGRYLLALGTREPRKNLKRMVEAFNRLKYREVKLVIVGKFGWGDDIQPAENVVLAGYVPQEDLPFIYSTAEVFVYPSLYEGFGLPVLEAMSCGVPVVTSGISSLPEVAGKAAILVDPLRVDEIAAGIEMAMKCRDKLVAVGLAQSKKFSWQKAARETLAVYRKASEIRGNEEG